MKSKDPLPLWLESIPDREPWRRGRDAICFMTLLAILGETAFLIWSILQGDFDLFLLAAGLGGVGVLFLFFTWVGRNWPRWIVAPIFAILGFGNVIWGMSEGNGQVLLLGIAALILFSYLALAPSVYAFARHQREQITLAESLVVALIFCMVLGSVGCGLYAVYAYVSGIEGEAETFAATAFNKVFVDHDADFLASNLKDDERELSPQRFIGVLNRQLGQPRGFGKLEERFTTRLVARRLWVEGQFQLPVNYGFSTPVYVNIEVSRIGNGWQIDHIGWSYQPGKI